jgi:hypothetical protein
MRIVCCVLVTLCLASAQSTLAAPLFLIDQQNLVAPDSSGSAIAVGSSFGQGFTPALTGVDAVELLMRTSGTSSEVRVDLLAGSGTVGVPLVSATRTIANTTNAVVHFDFPSRAALVPGNPYTLRFVYAAGNAPLYVLDLSGNPYPGGIAYDVNNMPRSAADFWFIEGLHVPEPATWTLAALGSIGVSWRRRRFSRR